jgi:hypothetical protein
VSGLPMKIFLSFCNIGSRARFLKQSSVPELSMPDLRWVFWSCTENIFKS